MPGGTQGPNIYPPLLAVCCLFRLCPCVPSLSVSLVLFGATPGRFGSASASLPSGFHPRATLQSLFTSFLRTCPIQHYLLLLTSSGVLGLLLPSPALPCLALAAAILCGRFFKGIGLEDVKCLLLSFCRLPHFTAMEIRNSNWTEWCTHSGSNRASNFKILRARSARLI